MQPRRCKTTTRQTTCLLFTTEGGRLGGGLWVSVDQVCANSRRVNSILFFSFFLIMFLELLLSSFYNVAVQLVLRVLFPWSVLSLLQLWHPSPI